MGNGVGQRDKSIDTHRYRTKVLAGGEIAVVPYYAYDKTLNPDPDSVKTLILIGA
jgi:hypothetical protein